jgi:hypothetical protein
LHNQELAAEQAITSERSKNMHDTFESCANKRELDLDFESEVPVTVTEIDLPCVGTLKQKGFDDWWLTFVHVPLVGKELPLTVVNYNPQEPAHAANALLLDAAAHAFLSLGPKTRRTLGTIALRNFRKKLESKGPRAFRDPIQNIDQEKIWQFIKPQGIYLSVARGVAYAQLACDCDWDPCLTFRFKGGCHLENDP